MTDKEINDKFGDEMCVMIISTEAAKKINSNEFMFWDVIKTKNLSKYTEAIEKIDESC